MGYRLRNWLWPLIPIVQCIRHLPQWMRIRPIVHRLAPMRDGIGVCYLTSRFPDRPAGRDDYVFGGAIKMTYLAEAFPHSCPKASILYVVSSVTHPLMRGLVAGARRRGLKVVYNQNGVAYPAWHGPGWQNTNRPMRAVLRQADYVLYQSHFCKLSADRFLGAPAGKWEIVYNPVDTLTFSPASADPEPGGLILLLGGNQNQRYRFERALQALALVLRRRPEARLVVTGRLWGFHQSTVMKDAQELVGSLGLSGKVEFLAPYTQRQAPDIMRRAHILLHTQYNDACPSLVVEAMACGLPVVYSASGGTPELVGGEAGIGVPAELNWDRQIPPDPGRLAEAVMRVSERLRRYAEAARQRAVDQFSLDRFVAHHREVFAQVSKS